MRKKRVRERWQVVNRQRARLRRVTRRAKVAEVALKRGNLKRVLVNLEYMQEHGDSSTSDKLIDFIQAFAKKGAQAARKHKVLKIFTVFKPQY